MPALKDGPNNPATRVAAGRSASESLSQNAAAAHLLGLLAAKTNKSTEQEEQPPVEQGTEGHEDPNPTPEEYEALKGSDETEEEVVEEVAEETEVEVEPEAEPDETEDPVVFEDDDGNPVTRSEARKGLLRQRDYTQKTQAAAAERKAAAAEAEAARKARDDYAQGLEELKKAITRSMPKEPDWDKLQSENPDRYPIVWAQWQQFKQAQQEIDDEAEAIAEAKTKDRETEMRAYAEAESRLVIEALPEWRDAAKQRTETQQLIAYAKAKGFSDQELNLFTMSKLLLLLRTAMHAERKPQPKGKPTVKGVIKTATPGSGSTTAARKGPKGDVLKASRETLRQTGTKEAAVRHIQNLMQKR